VTDKASKGRKYQTSADRDSAIKRMHGQGFSYRAIGKEVDMSANGVMHALRRIKDGRSGRAPR